MLTSILAASAAQTPPTWLLAPFVILLACIAIGPLAFPHFWHRRYPVIAVGLGLISVGYFLATGRVTPMVHAAEEYIGFIALIGALYIIAGGIHIRVSGEATPMVNTVFLAIGAVLSNIIGTTGASMLLVRPWILMNKYRITSFHVVFFIFIVSNVGGCLTPIGDPPLFMGYLKGIPFWWTAEHLWQGWLIALILLLGIFYVLDRINFLRAPKAVREAETAKETWEFRGLHNVFFIALVLFAVLRLPMWWRELLMAVAAIGSMLTTKKEIHAANDFNFEPLKEVVWLFIGIFATMVPALHYLQAQPPPLTNAGSYYWATGLLSGMLDNAPTYLAFLATALGANQLSLDSQTDIATFVASHAETLRAISLGAVLFGAMTYIGNGPNFMVKAIAEHSKVHTPTFIGYIFRYALPFLLPVLVIVWLALFVL